MMNLPNNLILKPIGIIKSPYGEKFAVPRQPNLIQEGKGVLYLTPPYCNPDAVRGLEEFSHLWLIFQFHHIPERPWHATVRPPRLGGNTRIGVFATRATHRPNPIGLSKVALEKIEVINGKVILHLGSIDLVDGTPIFDIKPYLAYADNEPTAYSSFAQTPPSPSLEVEWQLKALQAVRKSKNFAKFNIQNPQQFITDVIAQDPRPAYHQGKVTNERVYGIKLAYHNILWKIDNETPHKAVVLGLE
ncbi:tRNA-Thr(GGU) m(6)t(6)A37 methyltransferase TsaA [Nicoletella semolina]|uniref:tRNA-Thr(GGU) m(6)t(6)A37 methyltransferase TsaA n=2 Tax=Nicoletella semolina TaxID=271160 RepID=A0A4V2SKA7_9PAST|nr:tRNA-Thr(GGU) m(6)t(6)A37 methyltransferase TsaA [Nicoletella semolina]